MWHGTLVGDQEKIRVERNYMPVILVVDDSKTDRFLVRSLLEQESMGWILQFAESAEEAVEKLTSEFSFAVDVVVTDMMMPGMSGMELVQLIEERSPSVPVILMSGQGSESLAVDAIEAGASSYVPKKELQARLCPTIKQVLMARNSERANDALLESIEDARYRFRFDNDPAFIPALVSLLQQMAEGMRLLTPESRTQFGVAIDEAVINAIYHGNLELPTDMLPDVRRSLRNGEAVELIESRRKESPFVQRGVEVQALLSTDLIEVTIRDDGSGFDHEALANNKANRGITLIKSHVDEVSFNEAGNEIRLVKFRKKASDHPDG